MSYSALDPSPSPAPPVLPLRVRFVLERISALHRIPLEMIFEAQRTAPVMAARRHAWSEIGKLIKPDGRPISSVQIGRWFSVDHTTVLYGVRQHRRGRYPFTRMPETAR